MNGTELRLGLERLTSRACSYHEFSVMARTNYVAEINAEFCPSTNRENEYIRFRVKGNSFSQIYDLRNLRAKENGPIKGKYEIRWRDERRAKQTANRLLNSLARRNLRDQKPSIFYIEPRSGFFAAPVIV